MPKQGLVEKRVRREYLSSLPLSWPPARRSGRFPQLPYPPAGPCLFYVFFMRGASKVERERFFPNGLGNFGVLAGCMSMEKISPRARSGAGFILFFEALMTFVKNGMIPKAIPQFVEEHNTRIWRVLEHYVEAGRAKHQAAKLNKPVSDFGTVICLRRQVP